MVQIWYIEIALKVYLKTDLHQYSAKKLFKTKKYIKLVHFYYQIIS